MMRLVLLLFVLFLNVQAHKLNLFTNIEAKNITLQSYFASGQGCKECQVEVYDSHHQLIYQTLTNQEGKSNFELNEGTYTISVEAIGGHKASEIITVITTKVQDNRIQDKDELRQQSSWVQSIFALLGVALIIWYLKRIKQ